MLQDFNFCFSDCKKAQAQLRMGDEREEVDACEQAKAKVEERLYRVTVIERILASKGIQTVEKHKILGKSPFINSITEMREEERALLESELSSLRHHLHEAEAAIAVLQRREPRHPIAITTLIAFLGLCLFGLYRVFQLEHDVY